MKHLETPLYFDGARPMDPNPVGEHQPDQRSDEHGDEELDLTICLWSRTSMSAIIASSTSASEPFFLHACANPIPVSESTITSTDVSFAARFPPMKNSLRSAMVWFSPCW